MKPAVDDAILLSHGGGGIRTQSLIADVILRYLGNPILRQLDDSACLTLTGRDIAFTTDSYVVNPLFFPGGDIGKLAACGTINDLAMQAAEPRYMSLGLILEEGLKIRDLEAALQSFGAVLKETGVQVVTGDTKVVERGKGNGIFINTAGIGMRRPSCDVHVSNAQPGDAVIVTGSIGDHGMAVLTRREGIALDSALESDVAPLWGLVEKLLEAVPEVHCLRDPTRGGVAAALCDIAGRSGVAIRIREADIPVRKEARGACRLLGMDPLTIANEGKALVICPDEWKGNALTALRAHPLGREAAVIGRVVSQPKGMVAMETSAGGERLVETPSGEDLPRIC